MRGRVAVRVALLAVPIAGVTAVAAAAGVPTTTPSAGGLRIAPVLVDAGSVFASLATLTSSTIDKEPLGGFGVNTADGTITFQPAGGFAAIGARQLITQTDVQTGGVFPATLMLNRPAALGQQVLLRLDGPDAPQTFSWSLSIGPDQALQQLDQQTIAATDAALAPPATNGRRPGNVAPSEQNADAFTDPALAPTLDSTIGTSSDQTDLGPGAAEGVLTGSPPSLLPDFSGVADNQSPPVDAPASAPPLTMSTPPWLTAPRPVSVQSQIDTSTGQLQRADAQTGNSTVAVVNAEAATDAIGNAVPVTLTANGSTITMTVPHASASAYPIVVSAQVSAPSDTATATAAATRGARYGFSDQFAPHFADPNLRTGPLGLRARSIVRYFTPWNTATDPARLAALNAWLLPVLAAGLRPDITLTKVNRDPAPPPSTYEAAFIALRSLEPLVTIWGAWNEPNTPGNPLLRDPVRAAQFWVAANSVCPLPACTVVAGELSSNVSSNPANSYTVMYAAALKRLLGTKPLPRVWSAHSYHDVVFAYQHHNANGTFTNPLTSLFVRDVLRAAPGARIWLSEQGVQLRDNTNKVTDLGNPAVPKAERQRRQRLAALDFLQLYKVNPSHIDETFYYAYKAPLSSLQGFFDSALLDKGGDVALTAGHRRQAYCVLAYTTHRATGCPDGTDQP